MSKLRVPSFSISIDGFGAGPNQDFENLLGVGGLKVFDWFFDAPYRLSRCALIAGGTLAVPATAGSLLLLRFSFSRGGFAFEALVSDVAGKFRGQVELVIDDVFDVDACGASVGQYL